MFEELNEKKKELEEIKKQFNALAKTTMKDVFKDVFVKHPDLLSFKWVQYTPYFNDGEPCVFGTCDITVMLKSAITEDKSEDDLDWEEDGIDVWCFDKLEDKSLVEDLNAINKFINDGDNEDFLAATFGDGVQVIVTANGIETEEYDHD